MDKSAMERDWDMRARQDAIGHIIVGANLGSCILSLKVENKTINFVVASSRRRASSPKGSACWILAVVLDAWKGNSHRYLVRCGG